jgi:glyoxylase-like metal-dependent hydrolase (beta-lactamase superfamily II)
MTDGEIIPGVLSVRLRRVFVHVVLEPRLTLIDTGLPGSAPAIARALAPRGLGIGDIARAICTHGHPDHAGGGAELAEAGVDVLIHEADGAALATGLGDVLRHPSRGRLFAAATPVPARTSPLRDGDVLPVLGGLEVIHTPGHTPGSVCLWAPRDGLLFTGDVLQRRFGRVVFASSLFSDDVRAARRSVQRLASLDVKAIVFGHYPPLVEGAGDVIAKLAHEASRG